MLSMTQIGGAREDIIAMFGPLVGTARLTAAVDSVLTTIRSTAKTGAEEAIPRIKADVTQVVKSQVTPLFLAVAGGAGLALILSVIALWRTKGRR